MGASVGEGCILSCVCQVPILAGKSQHSCDMNGNSNNKAKAWPSGCYYGNVLLGDSGTLCAAASLSYSVLEKTALRLWAKTPWLGDRKGL